MPDLPPAGRPAGPARTALPDSAAPTGRRARRPDAAVALLSSGPGSSAWFEHRLLAERGRAAAGARPTTSRCATARSGTGRPVAGSTRSTCGWTSSWSTWSTRPGRPVGARGLRRRAGPAGSCWPTRPATGSPTTRRCTATCPELIGYYLDEQPALESVPTYRTSDEAEARIVLDRVGELVTKPVDGHGGDRRADRPGRRGRRGRRAARPAIAANPAGWVAQEVVALSSHPTLDGSRLQPRHVDLRAFVYVTRHRAEQDVRLADLALTRVAPEGSLVVNSSRGGGAKDTWIIGRARRRARHRPTPERTADVCGLAGEIRFDGRPRRRRAPATRIAARPGRTAGPDGDGHVGPRAGRRSAHRRLSIIDLSRGRRPADGGLRARA